jgi:hypothetical protein
MFEDLNICLGFISSIKYLEFGCDAKLLLKHNSHSLSHNFFGGFAQYGHHEQFKLPSLFLTGILVTEYTHLSNI